jgi:hypothetical protein
MPKPRDGSTKSTERTSNAFGFRPSNFTSKRATGAAIKATLAEQDAKAIAEQLQRAFDDYLSENDAQVAASIRRSVHPKRPRARTCCCFSSSKTLLIPARDHRPVAFVNVSVAVS